MNSGAFWSIGTQLLSYSLSLIFTAVLSRIVLPHEYGLINMVSTVTAFFTVFADGGLAWSVLQKKNINQDEVANLFWINVALGLIMALLCALSAPFIARFYGYQELKPLTILMSSNFIFSGVSVLGVSWLKRNLKFKQLSLIETVSLLVAGGIAIYLARQGYGYWALAALAVVKSALKAILVIIASWSVISWYCRKVAVSKLLTFSLWIQGFGVIGYLYKNLDSVLIAKYWGSQEVAIYLKAQFLMNLPSMLTVGALGGYAVSLLSKHQDNNEKFHNIYLRLLRLILSIAMPMCLFVYVFSDAVVLFLYGPNWEMSISVLNAFVGTLLILPVYGTISWFFISKGDSRLLVYWGLLSAAVYVLAIYLSLNNKAVGIATYYSIASVLLTVVMISYTHFRYKLRIILTLKQIIKSVIPSVIAIGIVKYLSVLYAFDNLWFILTTIALYGVIYLLVLFMFYRKNVIKIFMMSESA